MRLGRRAFIAGCICCALAPRAFAQAAAVSVAEDIPPLTVMRVADGVWRHTSWSRLASGEIFSSNGLIITGTVRALIVDTTWRVGEMADLIRIVRDASPGLPLQLTCTHAHDDRMSGVAVARDHGAPSLVHRLTQADAPLRNLPLADQTWGGRAKRIDLGGRVVELCYPGPAHTRDNVVVFDAESGVLFGGCQVRAADNTALGNVADANVRAWPATTRRLIRRYRSRTRMVVPGHGEPGGPDLLDHTLALAEAAVAQGG